MAVVNKNKLKVKYKHFFQEKETDFIEQRIHVGYLVNHFVPAGVETFILNLVNNLDYSVFKPYIYIFYSSAPEYIELLNNDVIVKHIPRKSPYNLYFFRSLKKELQNDRIQLLHTNNWSTFIEGILLKIQLPRLKMIYVQHGLEYYLLNERSYLKKKIRKILRSIGKHFYNEMVSVSKIGRKLLEKEWKANNVRLIYNGIDLKKFNNVRVFKREDFGASKTDFIICSVGRLMDVKNYLCLFKAVDILISKIPNLSFLHIGEEFDIGNKQGNKLFQFLNEKKLQSHFRFLGRRQDVQNILSLCDIFSLTSLSEGISLSLLEAQAAGLPAVVTDVGGNSEIIIDGFNGFLAKSDDEEDVAEKIYTLYRDANLRSTFSENAQKRIKKLFSLEKMVEKYQDLYFKVVRNEQEYEEQN